MRAGAWFGALTLVGFISAHELVGKNEICSNEGEIVNVKNWKLDLRCFTCMCKNGYVQCQKEPCPSLEGCHLLLEVPKGQCCRRCKGCVHRGIEWESGSEWRDPMDPCRVLTCRAGVVSVTEEKCYVPCHNPMPPAAGQCCPTCTGCRVNGQTVSSGRVVRSLEDPCLKCQCTNGRLSCSKRACPVLHCHPRSILPPRPGECCPTCVGSRTFTIPPQGRCLLGSDVHPPGRTFKPDKCTTCECSNGTNFCERVSCPVLDCPPEEQLVAPDGCCSHCPPRNSLSSACSYEGSTYKEGESWQVDLCKSCVCSDGVVRCAVEMCPNTNIPCPPNHKLVEVPGQCCPKCVESDGVCTVFGDPHYRTFDGKFYSFQGSCKYQLAADCLNHTFSIRVTNDARDTRISSWTKTVSIKLNGMKINLGEKRRVKINGERVSVPEIRDGVTVTETEDSVLVETQPVGLKVLWDGNGFLEISVPASYKGRLCGLCGNFNYISRDDMATRTGRIVNDPDKFGNSWRVGGKKACSRGFGLEHIPSHRCSKYTLHRRQKEKKCKILKSRVFEPCHKHLSHLNYFKSCIVDMCECPREKLCFCESFTAYAHECARLGVSLPNWRRETGCLTRH